MPMGPRTALRRKLLAFALAVGGAVSTPCMAQSSAYSLANVKAAFLYRFLEYVEWPAGTRSDGPLTIAVLGDDSLAADLRRDVRGRLAHGRPVLVRSVTSVRDGLDADVLFVGAHWRKRLAQLGHAHDEAPVLLVTEGEGSLEQGAVINFVVVDGNVRFEVSLAAAEQRGLRLSSRLLSVALRVEKSGNRLDQTRPETDEPYRVGEPRIPERRPGA
jgi:YfiR/HmsC-like